MADEPIRLTGVDLGKLAEPATEIVRAMSTGVGVIYEPTRIRRKAEAEADAKVIGAKAEVEVQEIQQRARLRLDHVEVRRQQNIEAIATKAITFSEQKSKAIEFHELGGKEQAVEPKPSVSHIDDDWFHRFIGACQDVGSEEMQILWSRLLAGEAKKPGSFSVRTLDTVRLLEKSDAELFTRYCGFVWMMDEGGVVFRSTMPGKFTFDGIDVYGQAVDRMMDDAGLTYSVLKHLENIGLMNLSVFGFGDGKYPLAAAFAAEVFRFAHTREISADALTDIGNDLYPISGAIPNMEYREWVLNLFGRKYEIIDGAELDQITSEASQ
jgi:hypothetical protein